MNEDHKQPGLEVHTMSYQDGAVLRTPDDEGTAVQQHPMLMNGVFYVPAHNMFFGPSGNGDAADFAPEFATIGLSVDNMGLSVRMSPVMMREFSEKLALCADQIDAHAAAQAADLIAKAAEGGAA